MFNGTQNDYKLSHSFFTDKMSIAFSGESNRRHKQNASQNKIKTQTHLFNIPQCGRC